MSRAEKWAAIELIWQDLSRDDRMESPAWHREELVATEKRLVAGQEERVDWETAKKELRKRAR